MDKETSARLAAAAKQGDASAFAALYENCYKSLYKAAFYMLGNRQDAEDVVMDAVADAFASIRQLRTEDAFSAWMFRIVFNKARRRRGAFLRAELPLDEALEAQDADASLCAERADLAAALAALTKTERAAVVLGTVCGYSSAEVAEILHMNANTVRSKQMRALAKMRALLTKKGKGDEGYGG
ncbi:MAG: RNA polymerase sigma factor [Oscillospiraceae bacterium]|nr:RNA polymerase sigma factor [Oscillospiraceae bacterium]